jgi:hypothetical protein
MWALGVAAGVLALAGCEDRRGVDRGDARQELRDEGKGSSADRAGDDLREGADRAGDGLREGGNDLKRKAGEAGRELRGEQGADDEVKDRAKDAAD